MHPHRPTKPVSPVASATMARQERRTASPKADSPVARHLALNTYPKERVCRSVNTNRSAAGRHRLIVPHHAVAGVAIRLAQHTDSVARIRGGAAVDAAAGSAVRHAVHAVRGAGRRVRFAHEGLAVGFTGVPQYADGTSAIETGVLAADIARGAFTRALTVYGVAIGIHDVETSRRIIRADADPAAVKIDVAAGSGPE